MTVHRYIAAGRLPAFKVDRRVRVQKEDVEILLIPIVPQEPGIGGATRDERAGHRREAERPARPLRLTDEERNAILAAIEESRRERIALAAKYKDVLVPSSLELLDEARAQRTRELSWSSSMRRSR